MSFLVKNNIKMVIRIGIIYVEGKSDEYVESLVYEYLKRTKWKIELIKIKPKLSDSKQLQMKLEGSLILEKIANRDCIICLDANGKDYSSEGFGEFISKLSLKGHDRIVFCIGGAYGIDDSVKSRANYTLSLSKMTLPHKLAKLLLIEQLYRAYTLEKGVDYHH